jgi:hypothetical protein
MLRRKSSIIDTQASLAQATVVLDGSTVVSVTKRSNFLRSTA